MAVAMAMLTVACGGYEKEAAPAGPLAGTQRVDESKAGNVAGRVIVEGPIAQKAAIEMAADPFCQSANAGGAAFESIVVKDGGLENVFVYVKDGLGNYYFDIPADPVKIDQQGCHYKPHVIGVRAGQPIEFSNSDDTMHNVHALPEVNQEFNFSQPMKGMKNTRTFTAREVMVRFKCDVHGWMSAYAGVMDHPYFAVTHDGGRFELKHLPAGTYTIEAWHEQLGTLTESVTIGEKESKSITFSFKSAA